MPSRLELPVVPGVSAPTGLPPCPGLRGEPCRGYQPFDNAAASLGGAGGAPTPPLPASGTASQSGTKCAASAKKHKKRRGCGKSKERRKR